MTVGDLLDFLATQPRDRPVILAKDVEGNGFSPLATVGECMYDAETTWMGQVYLTPEQLAEEENPGDFSEAPDSAVRAVELGPVN